MPETIQKETGPDIFAQMFLSGKLFVDPGTLTQEQLTDPDYRLKSLQKQFGSKFPVTCSKCHHCR